MGVVRTVIDHRASTCLLVALLLGTVACPARRAGLAEDSAGAGSEPNGADASVADAGLDGDLVPDGGSAADANIADGATIEADADRPVDAPPPVPELPPGRLVGSGDLPDGGAQLRIEELDDGYAIRLVATESAAVSVEPLARLKGFGTAGTAGVFLGRGCQRAEAGENKVLGIWSRELERCATSLEPTAVMKGRPRRPGCTASKAPPGSYEVSLFRCGRYAEPLFDVAFEIEGPSAPDAGAAD